MSTPSKAKSANPQASTQAAATELPTTAAAAPMASSAALRLGNTVMVVLAPGAMLRNTETGGWFEADTPMPQTVTVTLLRRLQDGDLMLCAPAA